MIYRAASIAVEMLLKTLQDPARRTDGGAYLNLALSDDLEVDGRLLS